MGTNYYHQYESPPGRYRDRHIGKRSGGWMFGFQSYDYDDEVVIQSWKDWQAVLEKDGTVLNEYNEQISFEEFKKIVENSKSEKNNHTIYCQQSPRVWDREHAEKYCHLDEEGWPFCRNDFS